MNKLTITILLILSTQVFAYELKNSDDFTLHISERRTLCEKGVKTASEEVRVLEFNLKAKKKSIGEAHAFLSTLAPGEQAKAMSNLLSTRQKDGFYILDDSKSRATYKELAEAYSRKDAYISCM